MKYSIAIPYFDDWRFVSLQEKYWRGKGRKPLHVLDSKLDSKLFRFKVYKWFYFSCEFQNPGNSIESGYESFVSKPSLEWILRLDSDEIPNVNLIKFLDNGLFENETVVGFERLQVILQQNQFRIILNDEFSPERHIQYRFFNRNFGDFGTSRIHTPGFDLGSRNILRADPDSRIYHLDFLLRGPESRFQKLQRYNQLGQPEDMEIYQTGIIENIRTGPIEDKEILSFLNENKRLIQKLQSQQDIQATRH